jgi:hypothetical protein
MKFVSVDVRKLADRYKTLGAHVDRGGSDVLLQPYAVADSELETSPECYHAVPARVAKMINRLEELRGLAKAAGIPEHLLRDEGSDGKAGFADRLLTFTASDETRDRYGDRILVDGTLTMKDGTIKKFGKGWQLGNFLRNPVFMPFHSYSTLPLGQALDTYTDQKGKRKRLRMTVLMNDGSANPLAPLITASYKARDMRTVSVGFMPLKAYYPEDAEERAALDLGQYGYIFGEQELWENSAVAIPANPNATDEKDVDPAQVAGLMRLADAAQDIEPGFALQLRNALPSTRTSVIVPALPAPAVRLVVVGEESNPNVTAVLATLAAAGIQRDTIEVRPEIPGELVELTVGDDVHEVLANAVAARILNSPEYGELAGAAQRLMALASALEQLTAATKDTAGSTKAGDATAGIPATPGTPEEPTSVYDEVLNVQRRAIALLEGKAPGA